MAKIVEIYADGSATTSANAGGWASVVILDGNIYKELSGHMSSATNNDAELAAAVNGLEYFYLNFYNTSIFEVTLISDSEIVLNWANGKYKFKQLDKIDQYNKLRDLVAKLNVKTQWVRGHSGNKWNERCDYLANLARKQLPDITDSSPTNRTHSAIGGKKQATACFWFKDELFVVDFEQKICETYNREAHGKRGSTIEIRDGKVR